MMDNYKVSVYIEPTDKYEKAKKAVLEAYNAINELSPHEKEKLAVEVFEMAKDSFLIGELRKL